MPFPFSAEGTVSIDVHRATDLDGVIAAVEAAIREAKPTEIARDREKITFRAGLFRFVSNWNPLVSIGAGELHFTQQSSSQIEIHYRISFVQLFVVTTIMVAVMFGALPILGGAHGVPLGFLAFAWLWLFGWNYVLTLFRFPSLVRNAAEGVAPRPRSGASE
jgi:hypothetical protein